MEILDEDMQMVRDALKDAPEYVKGHFENLLSMYEAADELLETLKPLPARVEELEKELKEANESLESSDEEHADELQLYESTLLDVKYWMHDSLVLKGPMRTDPRVILRRIEDVL